MTDRNHGAGELYRGAVDVANLRIVWSVVSVGGVVRGRARLLRSRRGCGLGGAIFYHGGHGGHGEGLWGWGRILNHERHEKHERGSCPGVLRRAGFSWPLLLGGRGSCRAEGAVGLRAGAIFHHGRARKTRKKAGGWGIFNHEWHE